MTTLKELNRRDVEGADLAAIEPQEAETWAAWLLEGGKQPVGIVASDYRFAVAQCADTLAWAVANPGRGWLWASDAPGSDVRPARRTTLLELRVFGPDMETLLWSSRPGGDLVGRTLRDAPFERPEYEPIPESMRFDQLDNVAPVPLGHSAFVQRISVGGRVLVTPAGARVCLKHYVQELPETGQLRIRVTRFVEVA